MLSTGNIIQDHEFLKINPHFNPIDDAKKAANEVIQNFLKIGNIFNVGEVMGQKDLYDKTVPKEDIILVIQTLIKIGIEDGSIKERHPGLFCGAKDSSHDEGEIRKDISQDALALGAHNEKEMPKRGTKGMKHKMPSDVRRALNRKIKAMCMRHKSELTLGIFEITSVRVSTIYGYYRVSWNDTI